MTLLVAEIISGSAYLAKVLPGHLDQMIGIVERFSQIRFCLYIMI
ncbi:hypothetical protein OE903_00585 [Bacillus sp. B6(2022)]|nr:hypothetical protein [Bacillus sp. B6(2022)]